MILYRYQQLEFMIFKRKRGSRLNFYERLKIHGEWKQTYLGSIADRGYVKLIDDWLGDLNRSNPHGKPRFCFQDDPEGFRANLKQLDRKLEKQEMQDNSDKALDEREVYEMLIYSLGKERITKKDIERLLNYNDVESNLC